MNVVILFSKERFFRKCQVRSPHQDTLRFKIYALCSQPFCRYKISFAFLHESDSDDVARVGLRGSVFRLDKCRSDQHAKLQRGKQANSISNGGCIFRRGKRCIDHAVHLYRVRRWNFFHRRCQTAARSSGPKILLHRTLLATSTSIWLLFAIT
jgi:hypothetical protein